MRSDSGELIPPAAFIDIAERSGAIRDIDLWVVRSACRMIRAEHARGRVSRMEVNVSGVSVSDPEFLELIKPELSALGRLATDLVFELTETAAVTNLAHANVFANGIAPFGCGFALDDFGVGFGVLLLPQTPSLRLPEDRRRIHPHPAPQPDRPGLRACHGRARPTASASRPSPNSSKTSKP